MSPHWLPTTVCIAALLCTAAKTCASKPSAYLAPNSAGWDESCAGSLIGSTCSAACGADATGSGYVARCSDNNTWTVVSGSCQGRLRLLAKLPPGWGSHPVVMSPA